MRHLNDPRAHVNAHAYSGNHRAELQWAQPCGCFHCLKIFNTTEIREWLVSPHGDADGTALCPHCGVDAVIGASSGYPITEEFLKRMKDFWFARPDSLFE